MPLIVAALGLAALASFPPPQKYVADTAHVLSEVGRSEIDATLRSLEQETTAEVAVVTVPSLDGMSVEEYANRLFKEWGIGKKGVDNGVLVLVAPAERKIRIEVGYGLEPILPDGLAGEIIRTAFLPRFKDNDYAGGIQAGVARVATIVRARHVLTPDERRRLEQSTAGDRPPALLTVPFFGSFIAIGAFMIGAGIRSKTGFPLAFGGLFGGIPFLMALLPFFNAYPVILVLLAILAGWIGYRRGEGFADVAGTRKSRRRGGSAGGWTWGESSGGSGSSSSSSSSGGSYGGGSSGGGGASGSW
jgi:uncharacterized protein